jgi:DNA-binding transcriptional ArsR family regulator
MINRIDTPLSSVQRLRQIRVQTSFIVLMVLSVSILGPILQRDEHPPQVTLASIGVGWASTYRSPIRLGSGLPGPPALLNSSTRLAIFNYVTNAPGVHFRGICKGLGLPVGVAQYHLALLANAGLLASYRDRRYKRYFEAGRFSQEEIEVISAMRCGTAREILRALLERQPTPHCQLASTVEVTSQALTWQMKHLRASGLIEAEADSRKVTYTISGDYLPTVARMMSIIS